MIQLTSFGPSQDPGLRKVVGVSLDGTQRVVQYRSEGDLRSVQGDHVIQATGFDNYSGPRQREREREREWFCSWVLS